MPELNGYMQVLRYFTIECDFIEFMYKLIFVIAIEALEIDCNTIEAIVADYNYYCLIKFLCYLVMYVILFCGGFCLWDFITILLCSYHLASSVMNKCSN